MPMTSRTGIQIGARTIARPRAIASRAASRETPSALRSATTSRPAKAQASIPGNSLIASNASRTIRTSLSKVFMVAEPAPNEKSCRNRQLLIQPETMSAPVSVPVVCALIERAGLLLLAQRPADKHLPLKWEFPGGKVEPRRPAAAIVREIREELACAIAVVRHLPRFTHRYERVEIG